MPVRQVVTGYDTNGKSIILSDEQRKPMDLPGVGGMLRLWSSDEPARYPDGTKDPDAPGYFPPVSGVRFMIVTLPGHYGEAGGVQEDPTLREAAPDVAAAMDQEAPGVHTTDTTDFIIIQSGSVSLDLGHGEETRLGPGDVVIQHGTTHRWINHSDDPITMAVFMVGAHRD